MGNKSAMPEINTIRVINSTPPTDTKCVECGEVKTTGDRIRQARLARGMSGEQLANLVGYAHQSAIGNLEARATGSGGKKLHLIAAALGVPEDWLRHGPDSDEIPNAGATAATTSPASAAPVSITESRSYGRPQHLHAALQAVDVAVRALPAQRRPELAKAFDLYITDPILYSHMLGSIEQVLSGEIWSEKATGTDAK